VYIRKGWGGSGRTLCDISGCKDTPAHSVRSHDGLDSIRREDFFTGCSLMWEMEE